MKQMYKSLILVLVLVLVLLPALAGCPNDNGDDDGNGGAAPGSAANPFKVASRDDLEKVGSGTGGWTLSACYIQTEDIDLAGEIWTPIGIGTEEFSGDYNGDGRLIKNLTINIGSGSNRGLFNTIGKSGTVSNIRLTGVAISGANFNIGGVAGLNKGIIEGCSVSGNISGNMIGGGIVGTNGGAIRNCSFSGSVLIDGTYSGGIAAINSYGVIEFCHVSGDVKGVNYAGGVTGDSYYDTAMVNNNAALLTSIIITSSGTPYIGRVVGQNRDGGSMSNNHANSHMEMYVNSSDYHFPTEGADLKDGQNVLFGYAPDNYNTQEWWETSPQWDFGDSSAWEWDDIIGLPVLKHEPSVER